MTGKTRNSSIELLRIICIFGIIFMHTIAYGGDELAVYNRYLLIVVNCFTNLGVTCFMLISGYFGVTFNLEKLIKLDLMVIFYTLIHLIIRVVLGVEIGLMDLLSCAFPVLSNQYWYITAYFIIAILSTYINQIPERLLKNNFEKILAVLIFLFSVVPTFLHFDILGSEGKNVVYMTVVYLIGRYIRRYDARTYRRSRLAVLLLCNIFLVLLLETTMFILTRRYSMFYRDCSIFTLISSVLLFTIFRNSHFENKTINKVAGSVLAVYVFSYGFQRLVYLLLPLEEYAFSPMLFPMICIFAPCVVVGCIVIDLLRQLVFGNVEAHLAGILAKWLRIMIKNGQKYGTTFMEHIVNYLN